MRRPAAILRALLAAGCAALAHTAFAQDATATAPTVSIVIGISAGDILNIRTKAAPFGPVKSRVPNGTSLKNYGCTDFNGYAWCKVEELGRPELVGWTPERYLRTADQAEAEAAIADAAAVQNTAAVGTSAEDMDAGPLHPPADAPQAAPADTGTDIASAPLPDPLQAAREAAMPEAAGMDQPTTAESAIAATAPPPVIAGTYIGKDAPAKSSQAAPANAPIAGMAEPVKPLQTTEQPAVAQDVAPAPPIAVQRPKPRLTAWDKMALAGRALIIGEPAQAEAAKAPEPEEVAVAEITSPALATTMTPPAVSRAASSAVAVRSAPPPPVVVKTTVVPAPVPPADLLARLGGEDDQPKTPEAQQQSTTAFGQTANEDAYVLAFAAQDNAPTGGTAQDAAPDPQSAADDIDAGLPAETVSVPSVRPGIPTEAATETQVAAASLPAGQAMPLAARAEATGEIPCARYFGQPISRCEARVVRTDDDTADVTVTWPDGGTRIINFRIGKAAGSNARGEFKLTREGDLNMIRIGTAERFEILDAFVFGG